MVVQIFLHILRKTTNTVIRFRADYLRVIYILKVAYDDRVEEVKVIKDQPPFAFLTFY